MTNDQLQAHLKSGTVHKYGDGHSMRLPVSRIVCVDGFNVSVQANTMAYCTPRDLDGPYTHVELGYPSKGDELIYPYADDTDNLTGTVYPQVPVSLVLELIEKHGGAAE